MKEIKIRCEGKDQLSIDELKDIQGAVKSLNPKELEKLLNSMSSLGFLDPFEIWKHNGENIVLGGNQRLKAIKKARELGWKVPEKFPVIFIEAKDETEARKMLLSLASTFGETDKGSLEDFAKDFNLDIKEIASFSNFPEFNLNLNEDEDEDESIKQDNDETVGKEGISILRIPFFDEDIERARELFESSYQKVKELHPEAIAGPSDAFLFIMQYIKDQYNGNDRN